MNYAHYYSGAFSNGLMSRSTPLPLDPQPVEIHFEQVYDFDYCAPAESFGFHSPSKVTAAMANATEKLIPRLANRALNCDRPRRKRPSTAETLR